MPEQQTTTEETTDTTQTAATAETTDTEQTQTTETTAPETFDKSYVEKLRQESANYRTKARDAETAAEARINKILEAAGIKPADQPLDPAKLTADLSAKDQTIRALTVERALDKAARKNGADEDLLAAVLNHQGALGKLDPSADDFATVLDALVKSTVDANPKLKAARAAGASGVELGGGTGEQGQITEAQLKRMTPDEIVAAQEKGRLKHLLG